MPQGSGLKAQDSGFRLKTLGSLRQSLKSGRPETIRKLLIGDCLPVVGVLLSQINTRVRIISAAAPCRPCRRRTCPPGRQTAQATSSFVHTTIDMLLWNLDPMDSQFLTQVSSLHLLRSSHTARVHLPRQKRTLNAPHTNHPALTRTILPGTVRSMRLTRTILPGTGQHLPLGNADRDLSYNSLEQSPLVQWM